jgi:hypothetical protein
MEGRIEFAVFVDVPNEDVFPEPLVVVRLAAVFIGTVENTKPPPVSGGLTTDGIVDVRVAEFENCEMSLSKKVTFFIFVFLGFSFSDAWVAVHC